MGLPSCVSPQGLTGVAVGLHTFTVTVTDQVGHQDAASFSWEVPDTSTPEGMDVVVTPTAVDDSGDPIESPIEFMFEEVTGGGETTVTVTETPSGNPGAPPGFKLGSPPVYFDLETTATFTGSVEICFDYSVIGYTGPEKNLKLFHFDEAANGYVDVTTSLDTEANIICGSVTSFSAFVIVEPAPVAAAGPD